MELTYCKQCTQILKRLLKRPFKQEDKILIEDALTKLSRIQSKLESNNEL